jgi:hypothetical protein
MENLKVENMTSPNGNDISNQFIIRTDKGTYFQSYQSIIVVKSKGVVTLDRNKWDYSKTTGKYRNQFLGETKKETEAKIKDGTYKLDDLN